jgi:2-amino-4-hydroxy-6-hydroxymethyldihydropteridine diphosphokinase
VVPVTDPTDAASGAGEGPGAHDAVVALGANLGDGERALRAAAAALARLGRVLRASEIYRTEPVGGPPGQPPFRNAVLVLRPAPAWASPERLLDALLALEVAAGRVRTERWGPRLLDLDLIGFGSCARRSRDLVLPHPHATERAFVMIPLAQAWPTWLSADGRSARWVADYLGDDGVEPTGVPLWP